LQSIHDYQITGASPLPVPVSFLIDGSGKVSVIYKGPLDLNKLIADLEHSKGNSLERFARSAPIPGRTLPIPTASRLRNRYEAQYRFATYLQQNGQADLAASEYLDLIQSYPNNAGPHNNLGISHIRKKQYAMAEARFREALRIQPDHDRAHANLGRLLVQKNQIKEALEHFKKAVELESGSASNHVNLGFALAKQGQLQAAVNHLEQALKLQPDHPDAKRNLTAIQRLINKGK